MAFSTQRPAAVSVNSNGVGGAMANCIGQRISDMMEQKYARDIYMYWFNGDSDDLQGAACNLADASVERNEADASSHGIALA